MAAMAKYTRALVGCTLAPTHTDTTGNLMASLLLEIITVSIFVNNMHISNEYLNQFYSRAKTNIIGMLGT